MITPSAAAPTRHARVAHIMGTAISIHVIGPIAADALDDAARGCFDHLERADRVFSTYRPDSDVRRLARGAIAPGDLDPWVTEVADECASLESATGGIFSARWSGSFDPTGFVKGWAVETAARRHLLPLLDRPGAVAVGISAGGDMQLFTADDADWTWNVGIADPADRTRLIATVPVRNGAVATSGTAERGAHLIDPRTGEPATGVASATVIADGLSVADAWATTAAVAGFDDLGWITAAPPHVGMSIAADGRVRRWIDATEVRVGISPGGA